MLINTKEKKMCSGPNFLFHPSRHLDPMNRKNQSDMKQRALHLIDEGWELAAVQVVDVPSEELSADTRCVDRRWMCETLEVTVPVEDWKGTDRVANILTRTSGGTAGIALYIAVRTWKSVVDSILEQAEQCVD